MEWLKAEVGVAIYAAIVATAALLLNLRTWLEERPKLRINLMIDASITGGDPKFDEKGVIVCTVINRGKSSTVITAMVLLEMNSWWRKWLIRPKTSYLIPNPQLIEAPPVIPADLEPYKKWQGIFRPRIDLIPKIYNGDYYLGVYATHRDRPYLKAIKRNMPKALRDAKPIA